ncbi:MAG: hypothetical protein JW776_05575 [Candidatus Lokiarchaeota archaeon]|nr:hypothetical protein [Candidatus Lokiarchaeota archaeon]
MNKKYISYIVLGMVLLGTIATLSTSIVAAQGDIEVGQDKYQTKLQAQTQATYRFRARTRVRVNSSADVNINIDCDANNIGDKTFSIDILNATREFELNMTLRRDQEQLGVQNGSTIRNQHRHQIRVGFAIQIDSNMSVKARLGMEMTQGDADRLSWAYFNEDTEEWVEVESSYEDGMLVTETEHFSVWTITESNTLSAGLWVLIGFGIASVAVLPVILNRKKKVSA